MAPCTQRQWVVCRQQELQKLVSVPVAHDDVMASTSVAICINLCSDDIELS